MLTITLLGTAATMPLPDRALTAALAECGGHALLFDCGEGTQAAASAKSSMFKGGQVADRSVGLVSPQEILDLVK